MYRRILTIQDISCVGQCSMTVALPILSACGLETCVLPSSILPTNSGLLGGSIQKDLTEDFLPICTHWEKVGIDFDGIYTGYLGSARQVELVQEIFRRTAAPAGRLIVDPAMADHGRLYSGFDETYAQAMGKLCRNADLILPNLTEACMLTGTAWKQSFSQAETEQLLYLLSRTFSSRIVLTGVSFQPGKIGAAVLENGEIRYYFHELVEGSYHGTGDIFASVLTGAWMRGSELYDAAVLAADFTAACIAETHRMPAHAYGVKFETVLPKLLSFFS